MESRNSNARTSRTGLTQIYVKDGWVDALMDLNINKIMKMQKILEDIEQKIKPSLKDVETEDQRPNCKKHIDRIEGTVCNECGTNHTLTFELLHHLYISKEKVRKAIGRCPIRARAKLGYDHMELLGDIPTCLISIKELEKELGF